MVLGVFPQDALVDSSKKLTLLLDDNKKAIAELLKQKKLNYLNFIRPFMDLNYQINGMFTPISHLNSVKSCEESQNAFSSCIGILTEYYTEQSHNVDIYNAYLAVKKREYKKLTYAQQKVLDDAIFAFELEGVSLPDKQKVRIKEINVRLNEISDTFGVNVLNATNAYKLTVTDESCLGAMPEGDKLAAKVSDGKWEFTLQMPSYVSFMTYSVDRDKREHMYKAYCTRAPENGKLIEETLKLRKEKANILGYKNYADLNLRTMSAPSVGAVLEFLYSLGESGKPYAIEDRKSLESYAKKESIDKLEPYDTAYISEKLKKTEYSYDEEEVRPYLEQQIAVDGMFAVFNKLFGIAFKEREVKLWDTKAKFYEMYIGDKLSGGLYLDLESRADKRGGAWMNDWHGYHKDAGGKVHLPEVFVVCNFPVSSDSNPSLLRHSDLTTLFHEMGHALHHLLSQVEEIDLSGVNGIDWDTVEFPSQFLENFAYESDVLNMLSKHYKTGKKLPTELLDKIIKAKNFQSGMALVRQLEFGLFDMLIHIDKITQEEVQGTLDKVRKEVAVFETPKYNKFQNGFSHIFSGGYAAGYYSYKWAEMLAADAFCEFIARGVFNKELALKYKDTVLALGASKKMDEIYRMFMGRDPDPDAILRLADLN